MVQTVPQQGPQDPGDKFIEFRCERWREVYWSFFRHGTPKISFQCRLEQESSKYWCCMSVHRRLSGQPDSAGREGCSSFFLSIILHNCKQKFRQGLKDVVAKKKATSKRSTPESASANGILDDTSNAGRVFSAGHGASEASQSKESMRLVTKVEIGLNLVPTTETLSFYEVRCKLRF